MATSFLPRPLMWLLVPLCYYAGAKVGVLAAVMPEGIAVLWPPNAVLLTAMLLRPRKDMVPIALLGIGAEVAADLGTFTVSEALTFGVANAFESSLACLLLNAWRVDLRLATLADMRKFLVAGPLVAAPLAAALGAAVYSLDHGGRSAYLDLLRVWWLGDAMGLLIFTPLLLSLALGRGAGQELPPGDRVNGIDAAVVLAGAAITAVLITSTSGVAFGMHLAPVLVIPCVVYLAARFDLRVVSVAVAAVGLLVAYATAHGRHPFGVLPSAEASLRAQEFILTMSLLALGLVALLGQLRARQRELGEANARLDQLNRSLEMRVAERTAQLDESNRQLRQLAMTDALTGLSNRRAFFSQAHAAMESALRHQRPLAVLMIDLDNFKTINDSHGHVVGDRALLHVASTLAGLVRGGDVLARYGGEEFVLLAPDTDLPNALALARRMGDALRARKLELDGLAVAITASFGVTAFGGAVDDLDGLMRRADMALYASKRSGRDRATAVTPEGRPFQRDQPAETPGDAAIG